jgi:thiol:disulfide interchange protein
MSTAHNPLFEKVKNTAAKLNRRRQTASDTSKAIVARREAFFDRLALMNVGALTFSVTLAGRMGNNTHLPKTLFGAWGFLLLAAGACLVRNLSHQHYQMADALTNMAESEVAYIDVDHEVISTENVMYADSTEQFDQNREVTLNRANREIWKKTLETQQRAATRHWGIVHTAEWVAGSAMLLGFAFLITFALRNL